MPLSYTLESDVDRAAPPKADLRGIGPELAGPDVPEGAPLGPIDELYQRGFEAAFGDEWASAYARVVAIAHCEGPVAAARAVEDPSDLVPGAEASASSTALASALRTEAERMGGGALRPLAELRVGVGRTSGSSPSDARVEIKDGPEVGDGLVTIATTIYIYGSGATQEVADTYSHGIWETWGQRPNGMPWTYVSTSGETYEVRFNVAVELYDPDDPTRAPGLFSGRLHPANRDNFIRVEADLSRSFVWLGENGMWRSEGRDGDTLYEDNPAAHEFGHLLGLPDRYRLFRGGPRTGWEGNVMAMPAGHGVVEQRDIDRIVARHVERFERADVPTGQVHHSSIAPLF